MAEISPARVVYPDNRYKQIFSCYLFLILCFLGWSVEGSVEIVRGPVHKAVHGPGVSVFGSPVAECLSDSSIPLTAPSQVCSISSLIVFIC